MHNTISSNAWIIAKLSYTLVKLNITKRGVRVSLAIFNFTLGSLKSTYIDSFFVTPLRSHKWNIQLPATWLAYIVLNSRPTVGYKSDSAGERDHLSLSRTNTHFCLVSFLGLFF